MITKLEQIIDAAKERGKKRLVIAYAADAHTISAASRAVTLGVVDATILGESDKITEICHKHNIDPSQFNIIEESNPAMAVKRSIAIIKSGDADFLMKGSCSTDVYMRGILAKEGGLIDQKGTLSHVTILEMPAYHKLLVISDVAVIPAPTLSEKIKLTQYVTSVCHSLGIEKPKVAIVAPTELVLPKLQSCVDAALIAKMADRGQIKGAIVDGPLAVDVAIDKEAAEIKGLHSPINGEADALVFPTLESANAFFKCTTKLCKASLAGMVIGASAPCVLTSRGDSEDSKVYSIAMAALQCK